MRVFKNKWFTKFAKKERISDSQLYELIKEMERGSIDVDYGGGVIKQRLARANQGKSGGYRCIILYLYKELAFDNINQEEEQIFKDLSQQMYGFSDDDIERLLRTGALVEVYHEYE